MKILAILLLSSVCCFAADDKKERIPCFDENNKLGEYKLNEECEESKYQFDPKLRQKEICCPYGKEYDGIADCGNSAIVAGQDNADEAALGEFPWSVAILKNGTNEYLGGGSLIRRTVVLTAAHIFRKFRRPNLVIRAGVLDKNDITSNNSQIISVNRILSHTGYIKGPNIFDVSLLFLSEPVELTKFVSLVCLPTPEQQYQDCFMSGWGKKNYFDIESSEKMKKIKLPLVEHKICQTSLRTHKRLGENFKLHDSFLCAGGEANKDACVGDGGSALVCHTIQNENGKTRGQYVQVGLVSWGIGCGIKGLPGGYTNVSQTISWIDRTLKKNKNVNPAK